MKLLFTLLSICLFSLDAFGAQQHINFGTNPNDYTGDSPRAEAQKIEANFNELYSISSTTGGTNASATRKFLQVDTEADLRWFGAKMDGTTDDSTAWSQAVSYLEGVGGGVLRVPSGTSLLKTGVTISSGLISIEGNGRSSAIMFDPSVDSAAIKFSAGASIIYHCNISSLQFFCSSNGVNKTAVEVDDGSNIKIEDLDIYNWTGSNTNNIGVLIKGRQFLYPRNLFIVADRPLVYQGNPNSYLSLDQSDASNLSLQSMKGGPCIMLDNIFFSNSSFSGKQSYNVANNAFMVRGTTNTFRSFNLLINDPRPEQAPTTNGYGLWIDNGYAVQGLTVVGGFFGNDQNNVYLRNVQGATFIGTQFLADGTPGAGNIQLNATVVDSSTNYCERVRLLGCYSQSGGTAILDGMTKVSSDWGSIGGNPLPETATFLKLANTRAQTLRPLFYGGADAYVQDSISNSVPTYPVSVHHSYTGSTNTPPDFGFGVGLGFYSDTALSVDKEIGSLRSWWVTPAVTNADSITQLWITHSGSPWLAADFVNDHVTFYPGVVNASNFVASSSIHSPEFYVTGGTPNTLTTLSGSSYIQSIPNALGGLRNNGAGAFSYTDDKPFAVHATSYSSTVDEESSNEGAVAEVTATLPAPSQGAWRKFLVRSATGIKVQAPGGVTIRIANSQSSSGGYIESTTLGDVITLQGINATEWWATSQMGTGWLAH